MPLSCNRKPSASFVPVPRLRKAWIVGLLACLAGSALPISVSAQTAQKPRLVAQVGHGHSQALAFSPDGRQLAAAESDGVRLWDVTTRREIRRFLVPGDPVSSAVAFSADGGALVAGNSRSGITAWNVRTGAVITNVSQSKENIEALVISPTGRRLAAGDTAGEICVWSFPQLIKERCLRLEAGRVAFYGMSLRFSPDGGTLSASQEKRLRTWDVRTGKLLQDSGLKNSQGSDWWFLGMSAVDPVAILGSGEIIDVANNAFSGSFARPRDATTAVAFGPNRRYALLGGTEGTVTLVDLASGETRRTQIDCGACGFRRAIDSASFSPDGHTAVTASKDDALRLWDVESLTVRGTFASTLMEPRSVRFSPDSRYLLVATRTDAIVWNLAEGREQTRLSQAFADNRPDASFSPAGNLAVTMGDGKATLWDAHDWRRIRTFDHRRTIDDDLANWIAAISGDETLLLTADRTTANLFRIQTGERVREFSAPANMRIATATFNSDGTQVVITTLAKNSLTSKGWPGETHVWNLANGQARRVTQDPEVVYFVEFIDDGRTAITGGSNQPIRIRNADTWSEISVHPAGVLTLSALRMSRDGSRLLTVSRDGATVWDKQSPKAIASYPGISGTWTSDLSPDGRWLVGKTSGGLQIWNIASGAAAPSIYSFADGSWAVADSDGRYDTADPNQSPGLHWVLGDEVIELGQLKTQFYTRGLLARSLRGEGLLDVGGGIGALAPRPLVSVRPLAEGARELRVTLTDAGGGLGPITVLVNGKPLPDRVVPPDAHPAAPVEVTIPLTGAVWLPGVENDVEVIVENAVDRVPTQPRGVRVASAPVADSPPPSFFGLVVGTGEFPFASGALNLKYPAQDARAMATALRIGATRLVGAERVHITVLASDATDRAEQPTKQNILRALGEIAKRAGARDTVVVFLAGHGLAHAEEYFYLTQEATSADVSDPAVRAARALSSGELERWLKSEIHALKYVVILDTCAAGAAAQALSGLAAARDTNDDAQVRAMAQLKEATGSFVLMGSAADKASYEASQYGQGLLTYALLQAMRGELSLHDGNYLMAADWLTYAVKRVRDLSRDIGRVQEPELSAPGASKNFQVARLSDEDKLAIPVAQPKPQVLRVICVDQTDADPDELEPLVRARLRGLTQGGAAIPVVYLDNVVSDLPGGFVPRVRYERVNDGWRATLRILRSNKVAHTQELTLPSDKNRAAAQIADAIVNAVSVLTATRGTS